jgi:hypothetical protein
MLLEKGFFQTKLIPFPERERAFPGRATWHHTMFSMSGAQLQRGKAQSTPNKLPLLQLSDLQLGKH